MTIEALLGGGLVLVTGKGGTGKTTIAAALALLGAAKRRHTVLCEVDAQRSALQGIFGEQPLFQPARVRPGLDICNIRWSDALADYVQRTVPAGRLVIRILENHVVSRFLDVTPGSREVVILSRIAHLCQQYDLVVVDMPASGHAFSLLDTIRSVAELFDDGPVKQRAQEIRSVLQGAQTTLLLAALPEDMVINETVETYERLLQGNVVSKSPMALLNRATTPSLTEPERELLRRLSGEHLDERQSEFVRAARWENGLEQGTKKAIERLQQVFSSPPILVPPAGDVGAPRKVVGSVAVHLGRHVGVTRRELAWT